MKNLLLQLSTCSTRLYNEREKKKTRNIKYVNCIEWRIPGGYIHLLRTGKRNKRWIWLNKKIIFSWEYLQKVIKYHIAELYFDTIPLSHPITLTRYLSECHFGIQTKEYPNWKTKGACNIHHNIRLRYIIKKNLQHVCASYNIQIWSVSAILCNMMKNTIVRFYGLYYVKTVKTHFLISTPLGL